MIDSIIIAKEYVWQLLLLPFCYFIGNAYPLRLVDIFSKYDIEVWTDKEKA